MLSPLCFVERLLKFSNTSIQGKFTIHCDNIGLVDNVNKHLPYVGTYYPNDTLAGDWDLVHEISVKAASLPNAPTIKHIKGHQDKQKKYKDLSLAAQLNVDADRLADMYMQHHHDQHLVAPLLPSHGAQLHLPEGTITNKLKRELVKAKRGPILRKHIREKTGWTEETESFVDWEITGKVMSHTPHFTTMLKFVFDLLPVGNRVHKYNPKYSPKCPSCDEPNETQHHFHHCPSHSRAKWRRIFPQQFRIKAQAKRTDPVILDILLDGLNSFFVPAADPPKPDNYDADYHSAITQQNAIGWDNFIKGRWSKEWRKLQALHYEANPLAKPNQHENATAWATSSVRLMWEKWYELWESRNHDRHGFDSATRAEKTRLQAMREIEMLYETAELIPHQTGSNDFFDTPLEQLFIQPTHSLTNWLNQWKDTIETAMDPKSELHKQLLSAIPA